MKLFRARTNLSGRGFVFYRLPNLHIRQRICKFAFAPSAKNQICISASENIYLRFALCAKSQIYISASGYANLSNTKFAHPQVDMFLWDFQGATPRPIREPQIPSPLPT
jgi:hypothetical protein